MPSLPLAPLQAFCLSGTARNVYDVRWSGPAELPGNGRFNILGVNIYRSFGSEYGPFYRINAVPVGALFWRDMSTTKVVLQEDVSSNFIPNGPGTAPNGDFLFKTQYSPIIIDPIPGGLNCVRMNMRVTVDGQPGVVDWLDAANGVVRLSREDSFDVISQKMIPAVLPEVDGSSIVLASYRYTDNKIPSSLDKRIFYRVTTVAYAQDGSLLETPIEDGAKCDSYEIEKLNYIWREAIRRNHWILDQGGERVKVFIKKNAGVSCGCQSDLHGQPESNCDTCFGTGFIGGYDGPYDITIAPDDAEMGYKQDMRGRTMNKQYETWTGPSPLLSQRDFILKLNGDRFGIGPVRTPSNRGMRLQQFFIISQLDDPDIRYKVPAIDPATFSYPKTRYIIPDHGEATPMITDNTQVSAGRQERGNTVSFSNETR
jgi:hypothetical protein